MFVNAHDTGNRCPRQGSTESLGCPTACAPKGQGAGSRGRSDAAATTALGDAVVRHELAELLPWMELNLAQLTSYPGCRCTIDKETPHFGIPPPPRRIHRMLTGRIGSQKTLEQNRAEPSPSCARRAHPRRRQPGAQVRHQRARGISSRAHPASTRTRSAPPARRRNSGDGRHDTRPDLREPAKSRAEPSFATSSSSTFARSDPGTTSPRGIQRTWQHPGSPPTGALRESRRQADARRVAARP